MSSKSSYKNSMSAENRQQFFDPYGQTMARSKLINSYETATNNESLVFSQAGIANEATLLCLTSSSSDVRDRQQLALLNSEVISNRLFDSGSRLNAMESYLLKHAATNDTFESSTRQHVSSERATMHRNQHGSESSSHYRSGDDCEQKMRRNIFRNSYTINQDELPEIIVKKSGKEILYTQEIGIRYLRPPSPPSPGDIIIQREADQLPAPPPPIIIRQQPLRAHTPEPLVIREAPPTPPPLVGKKIITISGKCIPPPPRKVIIERLAPLPSKPKPIIIERWLPYTQPKRRVIYKSCPSGDNDRYMKPKNVIVQWEAPRVKITKEFKNLGVIKANPLDYVRRFGRDLLNANDLPDFVKEIRPPSGLTLAADHRRRRSIKQQQHQQHQQQQQHNEDQSFDLYGDLHALRFVDLEREGLGEYRALVENLEVSENFQRHHHHHHQQHHLTHSSTIEQPKAINDENSGAPYDNAMVNFAEEGGCCDTRNHLEIVMDDLISSVDPQNTGRMNIRQAELLINRINMLFGKSMERREAVSLFKSLNVASDGTVCKEAFLRAFAFHSQTLI